MAAIPESGELREHPLPILLLDLYSGRFNGTLELSKDRLEKRFLFQEGIPIFAESNLASETLGVQLMDAGRITRDDHARVSSHVQQKRVKEGVALLELGLLDARSLFLALKEQVRGRLVDCFGWPHGAFRVEPSDAPPQDAQPFRADVYPLLQEGIETHWNAERILTDLTANMDASVARTRKLSRIQERLLWDESVQAFIDALDGSCTLWRALQLAKTPRALAAAWVLDAVKALAYTDPDEEAEKETPASTPDVEIVLTEAIADDARVEVAAEQNTVSVVEDTALVHEIQQKYLHLEELDHYALIDVPSDADAPTIRRAYLDAAKRFHPDALARAGIGGETHERAGKVFGAIGRAHAVLSNPKRRRAYDASLACDETDIDAERLAAAEGNYRKGEILMKAGNFKGAVEYLRASVELWPEESAYQGALGWALFKKMPSEPPLARQHLERAYEIDPRSAENALRLSMVLKTLGEVAPAANLLAKARELDPSIG